MTITIDEIKKLDDRRTHGEWVVDGFREFDGRKFPIVYAKDKNGEAIYDIGYLLPDYISTTPDADFIAASPQITAKCLELDEKVREQMEIITALEHVVRDGVDVNTILVKAAMFALGTLEVITEETNVGDTAIKLLKQALNKAGAL